MKNIENEPFSSRRYAERNCENPACVYNGYFQPHDRRQKFCCTQCRVNYYNDKRSEENRTVFLDVKNLKNMDRILHRIYTKYVEKGFCTVRKEIFHYEGVDVMLLVKEWQNNRTGAKVKGYFRYGMELSAEDNNFFIVHKLK